MKLTARIIGISAFCTSAVDSAGSLYPSSFMQMGSKEYDRVQKLEKMLWSITDNLALAKKLASNTESLVSANEKFLQNPENCVPFIDDGLEDLFAGLVDNKQPDLFAETEIVTEESLEKKNKANPDKKNHETVSTSFLFSASTTEGHICPTKSDTKSISCGTTFKDMQSGFFASYATVECPAGCSGADFTVTGSRACYTIDTSVCAAAIHAGSLPERGGVASIAIDRYISVQRYVGAKGPVFGEALSREGENMRGCGQVLRGEITPASFAISDIEIVKKEKYLTEVSKGDRRLSGYQTVTGGVKTNNSPIILITKGLDKDPIVEARLVCSEKGMTDTDLKNVPPGFTIIETGVKGVDILIRRKFWKNELFEAALNYESVPDAFTRSNAEGKKLGSRDGWVGHKPSKEHRRMPYDYELAAAKDALGQNLYEFVNGKGFPIGLPMSNPNGTNLLEDDEMIVSSDVTDSTATNTTENSDTDGKGDTQSNSKGDQSGKNGNSKDNKSESGKNGNSKDNKSEKKGKDTKKKSKKSQSTFIQSSSLRGVKDSTSTTGESDSSSHSQPEIPHLESTGNTDSSKDENEPPQNPWGGDKIDVPPLPSSILSIPMLNIDIKEPKIIHSLRFPKPAAPPPPRWVLSDIWLAAGEGDTSITPEMNINRQTCGSGEQTIHMYTRFDIQEKPFQFPSLTANCSDTLRTLDSRLLPRISVFCPANCVKNGNNYPVEGFQVYSPDSLICAAAVHAGALSDHMGGPITFSRIFHNIQPIPKIVRNGVVSRPLALTPYGWSVSRAEGTVCNYSPPSIFESVPGLSLLLKKDREAPSQNPMDTNDHLMSFQQTNPTPVHQEATTDTSQTTGAHHHHHHHHGGDIEELDSMVVPSGSLAIDTAPPVRSVPKSIALEADYLEHAIQSVRPGDKFNIDVIESDLVEIRKKKQKKNATTADSPNNGAMADAGRLYSISQFAQQDSTDMLNDSKSTAQSTTKRESRVIQKGPVDAFASLNEDFNRDLSELNAKNQGVTKTESRGKIFSDLPDDQFPIASPSPAIKETSLQVPELKLEGKTNEQKIIQEEPTLTTSASISPSEDAQVEKFTESTSASEKIDQKTTAVDLLSNFRDPEKVRPAIEMAQQHLPVHLLALLDAKLKSASNQTFRMDSTGKKRKQKELSDEEKFKEVAEAMFEMVPTIEQIGVIPTATEQIEDERKEQDEAKDISEAEEEEEEEKLVSSLSKQVDNKLDIPSSPLINSHSNLLNTLAKSHNSHKSHQSSPFGDFIPLRTSKADDEFDDEDDDEDGGATYGKDELDIMDDEVSSLFDSPIDSEVQENIILNSISTHNTKNQQDSNDEATSEIELSESSEVDNDMIPKNADVSSVFHYQPQQPTPDPNSLVDPAFRSLAHRITTSSNHSPPLPLSTSRATASQTNFVQIRSHQAVDSGANTNTAMDEDILMAEPMVLVEEDPEDLDEYEAALANSTNATSLDFGLGASQSIEAIGAVFSDAQSASAPITLRSKRIKMYTNWARTLQVNLDARALALVTKTKGLQGQVRKHLQNIDARIEYAEGIPFVKKSEAAEGTGDGGFEEDAKALQALFNLTRPAPYVPKRKHKHDDEPDAMMQFYDPDHHPYDPNKIAKDEDNEEIFNHHAEEKSSKRIININGVPIAIPKDKKLTEDEQKAIDRLQTGSNVPASVYEKHYSFQDPTLDPLSWVQIDSYATVDGPGSWTGGHFIKGKFGIQQTNIAAAEATGGLSSIILSRTIDLPSTGYLSADLYFGGGQTGIALVFLGLDQRNLCYVEISRAAGFSGDLTVYIRQVKRGVVLRADDSVQFKKDVTTQAAKWFNVSILFENRGKMISVMVAGQPVFVEAQGLVDIEFPPGQGGYVGLGSLGGQGLVSVANVVAARMGSPDLTMFKHAIATVPRVDAEM